jgi:integrase/recombinase XerD
VARKPQQRKHRSAGAHPLGGRGAPGTLRGHAWDYLEALRVQQRTEAAVGGQAKALTVFFRWCDERGLSKPEEVTRPILERYQRHLFYVRKRDGKPLSASTQYGHLVTVRLLFRWLSRQGFLLANPASEIVLPKLPQRLPRAVLTLEEVEAVLAQPHVATADGLRDRAMLELLYSTGLRRAELSRLLLFDVDATRGTVFVREGKGRKDRVVPIGERALAWVLKYIDEARPKLAGLRDEGVLFLGDAGEGLHVDYLSQRVRQYLEAAGLKKPGACHLFRHSMATAMLEGGADIRFVQEMLGHVSLETTQLYTRVTVEKLKAVHAATHPAARLLRSGGVQKVDVTEAELLEALEDEVLEEGGE